MPPGQAPWSDDWAQAIWDSSADALALSDPDGVVLAVNPSYCALYGYAADELVGQPFFVIFPEDARAWASAQYRFVFAGAEVPAAFEATVQRKDGSQRIVESRISFLTRDDRRVAMLSSIRDITEQKHTQATLERLVEENERLYQQASTSLRERDEFIAMASHELKTPLTALRGFAEILQRRGVYVERMVDGIIIQTRRLDRLIRNMLDLSLAESGHLQLERAPVDLVALAREVAEQTQLLTRQHTLQLELPERPVIGDWDAGRLEQVLQNLLTNAVKYSPDGGEIRVQVEDLGAAARVSIADQGIGIAPEAASQVFNRFYRTHEAVSSQAGGFGLGLPIARMIVEAHSGRIEVESRLGAGSTFTVTLPYASAETEAPWNG